MFATPASQAPLTQGDLFDDCPLVGLNVSTSPVDLTNTTAKRWIARVIVLTQACVLAQAKADRVLVARVHQAQQLVDQGILKFAVTYMRVALPESYATQS